jgi:hypothetical protein
MTIFAFILLLMIFGKINTGNFFYFFERQGEQTEIEDTRKQEFKKGFSERILGI